MATRKRRSKAEIEAARKRAASARKSRLTRVHRMTVQQYDDLKSYQGGTCPICLTANGRTKALAVEHDHEVAEDCDHPIRESCIECWRGLCCGPCNQMIGRAGDDPEFFYRVIAYLTNPPARRFFHGE